MSLLCLTPYCGDVLFADCRCLFKQLRRVIYHCTQYDEEIKKIASPSVSPFICNAKENSFSFIINSKISICMSGEITWYPLLEKKAIFLENYFSKILGSLFENNGFAYFVCFIFGRRIFACQVKGIDDSYKKTKCI